MEKFFLVIKENVIVLENLCQTRDVNILSMWNPGCNSDEISKLLAGYAKFHGLSMKAGLTNELASFEEISQNREILSVRQEYAKCFCLI